MFCILVRGEHTWMESSERLDDLVARARALFERKHGEAEGCFAAFSPAKVVRQEPALLLCVNQTTPNRRLHILVRIVQCNPCFIVGAA